MKFRPYLISADTYSLSPLFILINIDWWRFKNLALNIWFKWKKKDNRIEAAARHQNNLQIEYNYPLILNFQHCFNKSRSTTHKLYLFLCKRITYCASLSEKISSQFFL